MENREHSNQVSVHGNGAMASSTEQPVGAHLEISSSLHNVEVIEPSKASEKICIQVSTREHAPESGAPISAGNLTTPVFLPGVIQSSNVYEGICTKESSVEGPSQQAPLSAHMKAGNLTLSVCFTWGTL